MLRTIIGLIGFLTALFPERIVGIFEAIAIENPDESPRKSWTSKGLQLEGIAITVASLLGGRAYAWMMNITGMFGVVVILYPQFYREFAARLLFEQPTKVKWKGNFTNQVRLIGLIDVFLGFWSFRERQRTMRTGE